MINKALTWLRGEPSDKLRLAKQAFDNTQECDEYDFWQYVTDVYTLESDFRHPFYKVQALNGRLYTLEKALDFLGDFVKHDAIALKEEETMLMNELIMNNSEIVTAEEFKEVYGLDFVCYTFVDWWNRYEQEKSRAVMFVKGMLYGGVIRGNRNTEHLLEVWKVSLENALHIYESYCQYLRNRVDRLIEIKAKKDVDKGIY